jgi:hypothetical protein
VRFNIFLCFFLRMRLRRFLISEPMAAVTVVVDRRRCETGRPCQPFGVPSR